MDFLPENGHEVRVIMGLLQKIGAKLDTSIVLLVILACGVDRYRDRQLFLITNSIKTIESVHEGHVDVEKNMIRLFKNVGGKDV